MRRPVALTALALVLTACGNAKESRLTRLTDCLNAHGFLVASEHGALLGTAPDGAGITIRLYPTTAAARRAAAAPHASQAATAVATDTSGTRLATAAVAIIRSCARDG